MGHHYSLVSYDSKLMEKIRQRPVSCRLGRGRPRTRIRSFFYGRERSAQNFIAHINLLSSGRMCPAEKQTMQLQARAACASAVQVISADPFLNGSNTCGIPRARNLKIRTPLIPCVLKIKRNVKCFTERRRKSCTKQCGYKI